MAVVLRTGTRLRMAGTGRVLPTRSLSTAPLQEREVKPFHQMPGPKPYPVVGNIPRFLPGIGEFYGLDGMELQWRLFKEYGPLVRLSDLPGRRDFVFVCDPDHVRKVYRNEGPWPHRQAIDALAHYRYVTRAALYQGVGGVLTTEGKEWYENRTKVNQPMMQPKTVKTYMNPVQDVTNDFITNIRILRDKNMEMPDTFDNELFKWALESIAAISLDTRLGCLKLGLASDSEPQQLINYTNVMLDTMSELEMGMIPIWKLWSTPTWKKFVEANDFMVRVSTKYINQAMERMKKSPENNEPSMLERLLAENPDPKIATVMAADMIAAGIDTTSFSSANFLYHLAKNQDKQQKLFEELKRVLPSDPRQHMTAQDFGSLTYLRACMKESMRMAPVAPGTARGMPQDIVLGDYLIPKGATLVLCSLLMSNMDRYHPEADRFIPERWIKDEADQCPDPEHKIDPFVSLPFGFGPRSCVGRRLAELEIGILVSKVIHQFRVEYHHEEMKYKSTLLYTPCSPLKFKMVDRT